MCGRFYLDADAEFLLNYFKIKYRSPDVEIAREVYPSQSTPIIIGSSEEKRIGPMYWGFSLPNNKHLVINARSETIVSRPLFKSAFQNKRCLIPASGFYEWQDTGGKRKDMYTVSFDEVPLMAMAGIYRKEVDATGKSKWVFTVITCDASEEMQHIHPRMPLFIGPDNYGAWLDANTKLDALSQMLMPESIKLRIEKKDA